MYAPRSVGGMNNQRVRGPTLSQLLIVEIGGTVIPLKVASHERTTHNRQRSVRVNFRVVVFQRGLPAKVRLVASSQNLGPVSRISTFLRLPNIRGGTPAAATLPAIVGVKRSKILALQSNFVTKGTQTLRRISMRMRRGNTTNGADEHTVHGKILSGVLYGGLQLTQCQTRRFYNQERGAKVGYKSRRFGTLLDCKRSRKIQSDMH